MRLVTKQRRKCSLYRRHKHLSTNTRICVTVRHLKATCHMATHWAM